MGKALSGELSCPCDRSCYLLFNSISNISGQWADDIERLCALELHLQLKRSLPQAGFESGTARSQPIELLGLLYRSVT